MAIREGLPKGFVLAKPIAQEGYDESVIYELERQGRLIITRKRDGWKMIAVMDPKGVRLYTDGVNEIDSRFDYIKEELSKCKVLMGHVLVGEAIVDVEGSDDIGKVISIFHSSTSKSIKLQREVGKAKFMLFGVISLEESYYWSVENVLQAFTKDSFEFIFPAPIIRASFAEAKKLAVQHGWEGLVLYDKEYRLTYRLDGKAPARPKGCYKWKPILEDDFIVRSWRPSPNDPGKLKDLVLSQIDPATGEEFECGKLGSFDKQTREFLTNGIQYPFVVQVAFEMRFPKTGKIRNARFLRVRADKPIKQCIAPKSFGK